MRARGQRQSRSFPAERDSLMPGRKARRRRSRAVSRKSNTSKRYTAESPRDAVASVHWSGKTVTEVAREIGVSAEGLRNWVRQDQADRGHGPVGALTSDEKEELRRLRQESRQQQQTIEVLKKAGLLRGGIDEAGVRYAFIDAEKAIEHTPDGRGVSLMCRVLGVSRSGHCAGRAARPAAEARAGEEIEPVTEIRKLHTQSRRAHGAPRITAAPRRTGRRINRKRVERLMREHGIRGLTRRRRRGLTRPDKETVFPPDLVGRDFTSIGPGTRLVSDLTSPPALAGRWCPATVTGPATREAAGHARAGQHRASLVVDAPKTAAGRGLFKEGCSAHPDRGSQYTSREYRSQPGKLKMWPRVGRTGSCCGTAAAESFFGLLKAESGTIVWKSHEAARAGVFCFVEVVYGRTRLRKHPVCGCVTPLETGALTPQDPAPQRNHPLSLARGELHPADGNTSRHRPARSNTPPATQQHNGNAGFTRYVNERHAAAAGEQAPTSPPDGVSGNQVHYRKGYLIGHQHAMTRRASAPCNPIGGNLPTSPHVPI
ncbi:IS3 family transposase [Streptomyces sp. NPDC005774]|uniref:IS3 family transposase n=1 Tax=Streptomyces sp. NPDC005774 TaxID=3364728 RepID=UPI0036B5EBCC